MSRKVARTDTSTHGVSQISFSYEWDVLLTTFVTSESIQDQTKEVVYQGDFIHFQLLFQHKYEASKNTPFLTYLLCF